MTVADPSADLALEFFHIANGIVAFHLVQSIAFFSHLQGSAIVRGGIERKRIAAQLVVWFIASGYLFAIVGCGIVEHSLRSSAGEPPNVLCATSLAAIGRAVMVCIQAGVCSLVIQFIKEPPAVNAAAG